MVTDEVTVETRHYDSEEAFCWKSKGKGSYSIEPFEQKERGTRISFKFKKDADEQASPWQIRSIIKRYSDYIPYPIELNGEKVNRSTPIWAKSKSEVSADEYKDLFRYLSQKDGEPLEYIHINAEAPAQFNAIFFILRKPTDDCEALLPSWLRFVHGVVDTEDLPLNVSREVTQNSPVMAKLNKYFVKKLLSVFESWAEKDAEKFEKFWAAFGGLIKEGIHTDYDNRDKIIEIFRSRSSQSPDKLIPLREYVSRMPADRKEIFYAFGRTREQIEQNPNMEFFLKNGIEVLYLHEPIDEFVMPMIGVYQEKTLTSIDRADTSKMSSKTQKEKNEDISVNQREKMVQYFKDILKDKIGDAVESSRLIESPYTMVVGKTP
ncbi:hypothetical protein CHS0354_002090 [Potamilus streckersoni]|uniref:Uncharacterized protein n=1 Tax=Potamilus streckersoni TaxID=2493646 RepID=A0AAE0T5T7_9BIVA|nr:hypothetical protein CHS0354_002090 [Potamilus streckersoni]